MPVHDITSREQANKLFRSFPVVVIDHWASWCGPCQYFGPKFEEMSQKFSGHRQLCFAKCDSELGIFPEITGLPTIQFYMNGSLIETITGADVPKVEALVVKLVNGPQLQMKRSADTRPRQQEPQQRQEPEPQQQFLPKGYANKHESYSTLG